jgi:hypothetical protein
MEVVRDTISQRGQQWLFRFSIMHKWPLDLHMIEYPTRPTLLSTYLSVIPVHVQLVALEDVGRLVNVFDGQSHGGHDPVTYLALGSACRSQRKESGKVDVRAMIVVQCNAEA